MYMHEHIKESWPKGLAIAHYQKHIDWCKCKMAVSSEREGQDSIIKWYQTQIDKCLKHIEDVNAINP